MDMKMKDTDEISDEEVKNSNRESESEEGCVKQCDGKRGMVEDGGSIFVGNLPRRAGRNALTNLFSGFGKIRSARVLKHKDTGVNLGCGFVNFELATHAAMAIHYMDGYIMGGRSLRVNLVTTTATAAATTAPDIMGGCSLRINVAATATATATTAPDIPASATLFVKRLPESMNKSRLVDLFCPFGKMDISRTIVVRDKSTGKSKGYGFVSFETISDAEMARLVMNGYKIKGHNKKLYVATKRP